MSTLSCKFLKIYINWRLITLQYCGGFCHSLTWISHGCTCVPSSWTHLPPASPSHPSGLSQWTSFKFTLMSFIPLISLLDLLYHFGSTSSPTLSLFFPSSPLFLFQRYCLGSSSLFIVYCPCWISFIPIASVLPHELMTSKSMPWSSPNFQIAICIWIYYRCLKLYTPPDPSPCLPLIHAPPASCPALHPSSLLD